MSNNQVSTLVSSLESLVSTTLGSGYSKLNFVYDLSKNKWSTSGKRYGVIPLSIEQGDDIIGVNTFNQTFTITITDQWAVNQIDDLSTQAVILGLYTACHDILDAINDTKAGAPQLVVIVNSSSIDEPEFFQADRVVAVTITINLKYRIQ